MNKVNRDYINTIIAGDLTGLKAIYQEFLPRIAAMIRENKGTNADAQDILQESIMLIFEKSQSPDFQLNSSFYSFLYGIAKNLWRNHLKKKSSQEVSLTEENTFNYETGENPELDLINAERTALFWSAFQRLGKDCQQLLQLSFQKVKMSEIVEKMRLSSVGYGKKKKYKCKEKLSQLIKEDARFEELTTA